MLDIKNKKWKKSVCHNWKDNIQFKKRSDMKKIIIIFTALFWLPVFANPQNATNAPKWEEFCPAQYLNAQVLNPTELEELAIKNGTEKSAIFYCKPNGTTAKIIRGITIIPALDCWVGRKLAISSQRRQLKSQNVQSEYWAGRKKYFQESLKICDTLSRDNKGLCYLKTREIELQKTAQKEQKDYNDRILMQNQMMYHQQVRSNFELQEMNYNLRNQNFNLRMIENQMRW